ncbi:hypothetical protein D3C86_968830 [compost metagenome]
MKIINKVRNKALHLREVLFGSQLEAHLFDEYITYIPGNTTLPKILYFAPVYDYGFKSLGLGYEEINFYNSLLNAGYPIIKFDSLTGVKKLGKAGAMHMLRLLSDYYCPSFIFFSFFKEDFSLKELRQLSRSTSAITISWFSDDHWRFEQHSKHIAEAVDLSVTTDEKSLQHYNAHGLPVTLSQWASNHFLYKPKLLKKEYDVCFIGQNYGVREQVINSLRSAGLRVVVRGRGWPEGKVSFSEMIDLYNQSRICLNIAEASQGSRLQIKGRDFEVPSCGCVLLTRAETGIENYLTPGVECLTYQSFDELPQLITRWVNQPRELEAISEAGRQKVLEAHTWQHRFEQIFAAAEKRDWT